MLRLYDIKYSYPIQIICEQIYLTHRWTLTGTTTLDQSGPGNNENEGVIHTLQISRTGATLSDAGHTQNIHFWHWVGSYHSAGDIAYSEPN